MARASCNRVLALRNKMLPKLEEKAKMAPSVSDVLDYKTYNLEKLVISNKKATLKIFENRCMEQRCYADEKDGMHLLLDKGVSFSVDLVTISHRDADRAVMHCNWEAKRNGFMILKSSCVKLDRAGSAAVQLSTEILQTEKHKKPAAGMGCDSSNKPWPVGFVEFGVAQTLPELMDLAESILNFPEVRLFIGIKQYELKTEQLVAFCFYKREADDSIVREAVSFGTMPLASSTVEVFERRGMSGIRGVGFGDVACDKLGINTYQLSLPGEAIHYGTDQPRVGGSIDLYRVQAKLRGEHLSEPIPYTKKETPEEQEAEREAMRKFEADPRNEGILQGHIFLNGQYPELLERTRREVADAKRTAAAAAMSEVTTNPRKKKTRGS